MPTPFADLGLPAPMVAALVADGMVDAFPIQEATMPDVLAGRDVSGRAPTGSGKTLAFGLPTLARIGKARPNRPTALVLVPTRELAEQIQRSLTPLARTVDRTVAAVYGGVGYDGQRRALRKGVDLLVACPGRLVDLIDQGDVRLDSIEVAVLDEADQMADMGFLPTVKRLLDQTPSGRQTVLFSATLDGDVAVVAKRYQRSPVTHVLDAPHVDAVPPVHAFWRSTNEERVPTTAQLVDRVGSSIVFVRTRHGADRVAKALGRHGVAAAAIHGNRSQNQRTAALAAFADGRVQALVATDVAARGIHVDDVACVVHFDPPADAKAYVHRSGRTARAGASGVVVTLVVPQTVAAVRSLRLELNHGEGPSDLAALVERAGIPAPTREERAARPVSTERRGSDEGSGRREQRSRGGARQAGTRRDGDGRGRSGDGEGSARGEGAAGSSRGASDQRSGRAGRDGERRGGTGGSAGGRGSSKQGSGGSSGRPSGASSGGRSGGAGRGGSGHGGRSAAGSGSGGGRRSAGRSR